LRRKSPGGAGGSGSELASTVRFVINEVKREARRRGVNLVIGLTDEAIEALAQRAEDTNAILHVTC
jgi:hypothetical protein